MTQSPTIPGTSVKAIFQSVPYSHPYPAIYEGPKGTGATLGSLNAGNSASLCVGGGGINAAFQTDLSKAHQNTSHYTTRHLNLVHETADGGSAGQCFTDEDNPNVASYLVKNKLTTGKNDFTGIVFVDVFADKYCPNGNPINRAMVYAAPPNSADPNFQSQTAFLQAITETGANIVAALAGYNAWAPQQSPALDVVGALRLCMYSSGIYNANHVSLNKIALAIYDGIHKGLLKDATGITEVQMPVSTGHDTYFEAVKNKLLQTT